MLLNFVPVSSSGTFLVKTLARVLLLYSIVLSAVYRQIAVAHEGWPVVWTPFALHIFLRMLIITIGVVSISLCLIFCLAFSTGSPSLFR